MTPSGSRPHHDLLPVPLRRPAAVTAVIAVMTFAVLAMRYGGTAMAGRVDRKAQAAIDSSIPLGGRWLDRAISLGDPLPVITVAFLLAGLCVALRQPRLAVLAIAGPGLTGLATTLLKPAIGRTIDGDFAYPSGHTGAAGALGLVVALLVVSLLQPGPRLAGVLLVIGTLLTGVGMALALVAEDIHYATDTVGGLSIAVAAVLTTALVIDRFANRQAPT
ncbi:phosphatase PAP2 family protein [Pseudonocardia sp. H11422]|uniref:phosphatase PAP2 family protein n=1 Tax=Pseudonocardia sp. H11422 TaxID=2835866 RepID=UPI001BDD406D|nr:phosphatase PAP2 family protein [Pseudonocardia sp. H11422]